jgi:hypothetical protein
VAHQDRLPVAALTPTATPAPTDAGNIPESGSHEEPVAPTAGMETRVVNPEIMVRTQATTKCFVINLSNAMSDSGT